MMAFVKHACWRPESGDTFVRKEAIEGERWVFLGVHLRIEGMAALEGPKDVVTDEALFQALYAKHTQALAVVSGEPGCGKSHLIQWLRFRWPESEHDHVVLVPRTDGSLLGTLERLRQGLGHEYAQPLDGLGHVNQHTTEGRANNFLGALVTSCKKSTYSNQDETPVHADWLESMQAWRILNHDALRESWDAPRKLVDLRLGGRAEASNQEAARFHPQHLLDLITCIKAADGNVGNIKAQMLFTELERERDRVRDVIVRIPDLDAQARALNAEAPISARFLEALNGRCGDALQDLVGIPPRALERAFMETRRRLRKNNKRLVLLLEDITNLQGVDRQLLEALLPSVAMPSHGDVCELVAVIGVTPFYWEEYLEKVGNIGGRLSFRVDLTTDEQHGLAERRARFIATPAKRKELVATYLNAARLGEAALKNWAESNDGSPRPNACTDCPHRATCHSTFGAVPVDNVGGGAVGLYPLNHFAVERFWNALRAPHGSRTLKTPRGLLTNVLSQVLADGSHLQNGRFPTANLEGANVEVPPPSPELEDELQPLTDANPDESRRTMRTLTWWRDQENERSEYRGLNRNTLAAFGVHWPGQGVVVPERAGTTPPPSPQPAGKAEPPPALPPAALPPPPVVVPPLNEYWQKRVENLNAWGRGQNLEGAREWEVILRSLVESLEPQRVGAMPWLWEKIFTPDNIVLEGTSARRTAMQFVVPRDAEVRYGLTAAAKLRHFKNLSAEEKALEVGRLATFQRWLFSEAVTKYRGTEQELLAALGGEDPRDLLVKTLVVGSWLSSSALPSEPAAKSWAASIPTPKDHRLIRDAKWTSLENKWRHAHSTLLENVCRWLRVGQSPSKATGGLVDPAQLLSAVTGLAADLLVWPSANIRHLPQSLQTDLSAATELAAALRQDLESAIKNEDQRIRDWAVGVEHATEGTDAGGRLEAAKKVVQGLRGLDEDLLPHGRVQAWESALAHLVPAGVALGTKSFEQAADEIESLAKAEEDVALPDRLDRVLSTRHRPGIEAIHGAMAAAQQVLTEAHARAKEWIGTAGDTDLDGLHRAGERVMKHADVILGAAKADP